MSGLTVIRVRHRCCFLFAYLRRFGHWCLWAWNCQIAWDGLGAAFHTVSKTFRYARGCLKKSFGNQSRNQWCSLLTTQLKQWCNQWCILLMLLTIVFNILLMLLTIVFNILLMLLTIVFILSNNNYKFFPTINRWYYQYNNYSIIIL